MPTDTLIVIANVALDLFTISSMLAAGMSLTVQQVVVPLRNLRFVVVMLVGSFVLVPLLAVLLGLVLPLGDDQRTALILLGACAGGPFIPAVVRIAKGRQPLAVGEMILLLVVTIFYVPFALPLLLPYLQIDAVTIARDLLLFLLLPLIIGMLVRWRYEQQAGSWSPHLARFSVYSLLLMAVAGLPPALPKVIGTFGTWLIPGAVLLALGGGLIGYLLGFGQGPARRKVLALGTGQRNLAAALLVAAHSFGGDAFVMTLVGCVTLTIVMHIVAAEWGRRAGEVGAET